MWKTLKKKKKEEEGEDVSADDLNSSSNCGNHERTTIDGTNFKSTLLRMALKKKGLAFLWSYQNMCDNWMLILPKSMELEMEKKRKTN